MLSTKRRLWLKVFIILTLVYVVSVSLVVGQGPLRVQARSCCLPLGSTYCQSPCSPGTSLGDWTHCYECTDEKGYQWCCWYYWKRWRCEDKTPPYEPCHPPYEKHLIKSTADMWYVCHVYQTGEKYCEPN